MGQFRVAVKVAITLLVVALLQAPVSAEGEGAVVINHSDGGYASFPAAGGMYEGPGTLVLTPNGKIRGQANARLVSGVPVTKTTRLTIRFGTKDGITFFGEIVLTPSGNGNVRFFD